VADFAHVPGKARDERRHHRDIWGHGSSRKSQCGDGKGADAELGTLERPAREGPRDRLGEDRETGSRRRGREGTHTRPKRSRTAPRRRRGLLPTCTWAGRGR
jgi:hypothetical protein